MKMPCCVMKKEHYVLSSDQQGIGEKVELEMITESHKIDPIYSNIP